MPTIQIDFSVIPSRDPVSVGWHDAVVSGVEVRRSSTDPNKPPYLAFSYEVTNGDDAGKLVFDNASVSPQALWRLHDIFEALGCDVDAVRTIEFDESGTVLNPRLIGRPCLIEVYHEVYEDRPRAKIKSIQEQVGNTKLAKAGPSGAGRKVLK